MHKIILAAVSLMLFVCVNPSANAQTATFDTNVGNIVVDLFGDDAPNSVDNFLGYVDRGDYDGTIFHRSVNDFVVQGGGFLPDGAGIPTQAPIANEFGRSNLRGTIAFATLAGDPDSATSQFFFNVTDNAFLDSGGFTVFGEVVAGLDIVDAINNLQTVNAGGPLSELPVQGSFDGITVTDDDLIVVNSVTVSVPEPSSSLFVSAFSLALLARRRRV